VAVRKWLSQPEARVEPKQNPELGQWLGRKTPRTIASRSAPNLNRRGFVDVTMMIPALAVRAEARKTDRAMDDHSAWPAGAAAYTLHESFGRAMHIKVGGILLARRSTYKYIDNRCELVRNSLRNNSLRPTTGGVR
jgi:hypothetical protein